MRAYVSVCVRVYAFVSNFTFHQRLANAVGGYVY